MQKRQAALAERQTLLLSKLEALQERVDALADGMPFDVANRCSSHIVSSSRPSKGEETQSRRSLYGAR